MSEAIKSGRISHAYLFAGPHGVGKTSIARILAHQINGLPYDKDDFHLDIIEIDAASNRRIDEIRDLREKVHIAPTSAKYKIYIIDEVHMLTKEVFNALLKTLEEPPAHCVFILATTEAHKLPETIISRTQRFDFKPIGKTAAKQRLSKIAKKEKIDVDDEALALLAEFGEGSLRDIIGLLDQLGASSRRIDEKTVREFLGIPDDKAIDQIVLAIAAADAKRAIGLLDDFQSKAVDPAAIARALGRRLRQKILDNEYGGDWATDLLRELVGIPASQDPQEILELAVIRAAARQTDEPGGAPPPNSKGGGLTAVKNASSETSGKPKPNRPSQAKQAEANPMQDFSLKEWGEVLSRAKSEAPSLYSALRLAQPEFAGGILELVFPFQLHQKKVQEAKQLKLTAKIIEEVSGAKPVIRCLFDKTLSKKSPPLPELEEPVDSDLNAISNIFGAAEVLES